MAANPPTPRPVGRRGNKESVENPGLRGGGFARAKKIGLFAFGILTASAFGREIVVSFGSWGMSAKEASGLEAGRHGAVRLKR